MIIKNHTHSAVVYNYFFAEGGERTIYCSGKHIFYRGTILYSYGTHFPLAVKCQKGWILNGDRYSNTTSGHQRLVRETARRHQPEMANTPLFHCIIPFTSLIAAKIEPEDITILDVSDDTYETIQRKDPTTGEMKEYKIHHLGASLIRVKTKRYLSSIDNGAKRHTFFLAELRSHRVNTIAEAFRDLAGDLTGEQYRQYLLGEIKRQGEYFLEPRPEVQTKKLMRQVKGKTFCQFDLSHGIGNSHTATHAMQTTDGVYINGTLRHREHRMISMGKTWHRVYKNTARGSWSATGNVD